LQVRSTKGALKGPNVNIVSCLGRSWAMWDAGKMNLLFVGMWMPRISVSHLQ
jgi:U3 small nucleolar RNA-associated protein 21